MRAVSAKLAGLALLLVAAPVASHPLAPALLELVEREDGRVEVSWKTGRLRAPGPELRVVLPERCVSVGAPSIQVAPDSTTEIWVAQCSGGLVGARIGVEGLAAQRIDALLRVQLRDGRRHQTLLSGSAPHTRIPERPQRLDVAWRYAQMGMRHILGGFDHLLFVIGLVLLASGGRTLLLTVTAFTLGHSATLSLAALGFVRFPAGPIELLIALSVLALAVELAQGPRAKSWLRRFPWALAGGFGLLHGLGFAAALAEAGLPPDEIPSVLVAFNLGIELGQLGVIAAWLALVALLRGVRAPSWLAAAPVYAMGVLASYWCIARTAVLF
jgi:hydrogenase/urease accessory protein HupE